VGDWKSVCVYVGGLARARVRGQVSGWVRVNVWATGVFDSMGACACGDELSGSVCKQCGSDQDKVVCASPAHLPPAP
jgi:hypothetical protein